MSFCYYQLCFKLIYLPLWLQIVSGCYPWYIQVLWLSHLVLQEVSCCCLWPCFKLTDKPLTWFCRKWLTANPGLYFKPTDQATLVSAVCKTLLSPAHCKPAYLTLQKVNFHCLSTVLNLLNKIFLHPADCELLLFLDSLQAWCSNWLLILQFVSSCCPWYSSKPTHHEYNWLYSLWVTAFP